MQVTRAGYKDPNNLMFENITILGVSYPPNSSAVSLISGEGSPTTSLPHTMQYDAEKKVLKHQKTLILIAQIFLCKTIWNDRKVKNWKSFKGFGRYQSFSL